MQHYGLDDYLAPLPGALIGTFGWLGQFLMSAKLGEIVWVNVIGGLMVAAVIGYSANAISLYYGLPRPYDVVGAAILAYHGKDGMDFLRRLLINFLKTLEG